MSGRRDTTGFPRALRRRTRDPDPGPLSGQGGSRSTQGVDGPDGADLDARCAAGGGGGGDGRAGRRRAAAADVVRWRRESGRDAPRGGRAGVAEAAGAPSSTTPSRPCVAVAAGPAPSALWQQR